MVEFTLFRDIIANSPNGIIVTDQEKRIRFINKAVERLWSIDSSASEGKALAQVIPEFEDMEQLDEQLLKVRIHNKDYYVLPFTLDNNAGKKDTVYLILDIYENKLLRSELSYQKEMTKELEEILEGSFDGILVTDAEGKILYVNSSYERVAEIKKRDMEGKYMKDLINPVWMPNSVAHVVAEQKQTVSKRQIVKSGRHIIVTGRPVFNKKGDIKKIVINARDITEIYELTEELQQSKAMGKQYLKSCSRFLLYNACNRRDRGLSSSAEAAQARLSCSETASYVVDKAVQFHGGYGYIKDYPVERMYRDQKITEIYEGTSEVMKMVISGAIFQ